MPDSLTTVPSTAPSPRAPTNTSTPMDDVRQNSAGQCTSRAFCSPILTPAAKPPPPLTRNQLSALALLLDGHSDASAARVLGLHRSTLTRWRLHTPAFAEQLQVRRHRAWLRFRDHQFHHHFDPARVGPLARNSG